MLIIILFTPGPAVYPQQAAGSPGNQARQHLHLPPEYHILATPKVSTCIFHLF